MKMVISRITLGLLLALPLLADAGFIDIVYQGQIDREQTVGDLTFLPGLLTMQYTVDTTAVDANPLDTAGVYLDAVVAWSLSIPDSGILWTSSPGTTGDVLIFDDVIDGPAPPYNSDQLFVGIKTFTLLAENGFDTVRNWSLAGMTGFSSTLSYDAQANLGPTEVRRLVHPVVHTWRSRRTMPIRI